MIDLRASVALLDIEGTLGSISFVRDVLFPYADQRMDAFVAQHREDPRVVEILADAAREAGVEPSDTAAILAALHAWLAQNAKVTALKSLQGMIWVEGYEKHGVRAHVYDDAVAAMRRYRGDGIALYVYSSGSVAAQKLFFGYSAAGDLLPLLSGFFDTKIGAKTEPGSYARIAERIGVAPGSIAFLSDNAAELDPAAAAGMQTVQVVRVQDGTAAAGTHRVVATLDELALHFTGIAKIVPPSAFEPPSTVIP